MNHKLLAKMQDIVGLDPIGWWPLALSFWFILGSILVGMGLAIWYYLRVQKYRASWKYLAYNTLLTLEKSLNDKTSKYIVTELSALLRQIAIQKHPRGACASIFGQQWLEWLTTHDPKQFDWLTHGRLLVLAPYAPQLTEINSTELLLLIQAAKRWVK